MYPGSLCDNDTARRRQWRQQRSYSGRAKGNVEYVYNCFYGGGGSVAHVYLNMFILGPYFMITILSLCAVLLTVPFQGYTSARVPLLLLYVLCVCPSHVHSSRVPILRRAYSCMCNKISTCYIHIYIWMSQPTNQKGQQYKGQSPYFMFFWRHLCHHLQFYCGWAIKGSSQHVGMKS